MKLDLHIHTNASFDATQSTQWIIEEAKKKQLDLIAICDHNEIAGSLAISQQNEIPVLSGIEIDCFFGDRGIHLLAYGCDLTRPEFTLLREHYIRELKRVGQLRIELIEQRYGIKLDQQAIAKSADGHPFTNVEITQHLLQHYHHLELEPYQTGARCSSPIANYYWDQLAMGCWGYVEIVLPQYQQIIDFVHECGGLVIVAHPFVNLGLDKSLVNLLIQCGVDGFEVYSSYHDEVARQFYLQLCEEFNLIFTAGSDFHGLTKPNITLGHTHYEGNYENECKKIIERSKNLQNFIKF